VCETANEALSGAGLTIAEVTALGIGVPGPTDVERGVATQLPNLGLFDVPVGETLSGRLGVPVVVENDVNAGLLGEVWCGAAKGVRNVVGMFPGTGLGGGVVVDGRLVRGKTGITGEIGHMVMSPKGPPCGCGRRGCLEAYASRTAMEAWVAKRIAKGCQTPLAEALEKGGGRIRSRAFLRAAEAGDEVALAAIERVSTYLGYASANLIHLLSPEMIVLGGGVVEALAGFMLDTVRKVAEERCLPGCFDGVRIVEAQCGDDAIVLGVASLAFESVATPAAKARRTRTTASARTRSRTRKPS
jgi:glucokinase